MVSPPPSPPPLPPPPPPPPPKKAGGGKPSKTDTHDSSSPTASTTISTKKWARPNKFPTKLLEMLNTGEKEGGRVVAWTKEGDGIHIRDVPTFVSDVLPTYFRHSNINSFQRQLLLYGFVRDTEISSGQAYRYADDLFRRDDPDGCLKITRPSGASASIATTSSITGKPKEAGTSKAKSEPKSTSATAPQADRNDIGTSMPPTALKAADASKFALPPGKSDGAYHAAVQQPTALTLTMAPMDVEPNRRNKKAKTRSFPGAKALVTAGDDDNASGKDASISLANGANGNIGNGYGYGGQMLGGSSISSQYPPMYGSPYAYQPPMPLPLRLCRNEDLHHLSERQCYGRRHLIEYFLATKEDVKRRNRLGGNHGIEEKQIGLRCSFCCDVDPQRQPKASVCFPRSIKALNSAMTEMLRQHSEKCQYVPEAVKEMLSGLKSNRPKSKSGNATNESPQDYWVRTCSEAGFVDTDGHNGFGGIQLKNGMADASNLHAYMDPDLNDDSSEEKEEEESIDVVGDSYPRAYSMSFTTESVATSASSIDGNSTDGLSPATDGIDPAAYWSHRYTEFKNYNLNLNGGGRAGKKTKRKITTNIKAKGKLGGDSSNEKNQNERRISPEAVNILKEWLFANAHHPYTTDQQRDELCRKTGLNKLQVKNWLTNSRRRLLRPMLLHVAKKSAGEL